MSADAQVVVGTDRFADDLDALTARHGFRVETIFPADDPATAVVAGHGVRLRLERSDEPTPVTIVLEHDSQDRQDGQPSTDTNESATLPGGSTIVRRPAPGGPVLPDNRPSVVVTHDDRSSGAGRAGMRYRDLLPDRWGGRFISSHITIADGGPVPDYVHYHRIRFQLIVVKAGWVRVVYEDQGEPFVMHAGDCVLQPPGIRHRVLESSSGLEVIEIGCPAEHHTFADWSLELPTGDRRPDRDFGGQRFVRHVAADATWTAWRIDGWECRDSGIDDATDGLVGARFARPVDTAAGARPIAHDVEFAQLVVLRGSVAVTVDDGEPIVLRESSAIALPGGVTYALQDASDDCELLDVTLPARFPVTASTGRSTVDA